MGQPIGLAPVTVHVAPGSGRTAAANDQLTVAFPVFLTTERGVEATTIQQELAAAALR